jgi:ATP-dependent protease ClpP protease subunit
LKKIIIEGVIGWDYTAAKHRESLDAAAGDDLDIQISSTGGSVYDGNTIKQLNEKYKRDYPGSKVIVTTYGMAMSAASIIALSGDSHDVHEDSVYMIHNPWGLEIGDYRVMRKTANDLEKLSNMYARIYADKSKKSVKENDKK